MITKETVDAIRDTAKIEEVVEEFVPLKRRGVNMIGLCPFHNEKTPSFTVSPSKGIYKCFGCGASGDSIKFVMEHEHFTYPEALKYVAKKYNIQVEETEVTPEYLEEQSTREALFAVNQYAENYFSEALWNDDEGKAIGLSYFHERGFQDDTIKKFKLGYAKESWDDFLTAAKESQYNVDYLKTLGLVTSGERTVDMYRGRVIFPIHNLSGRVVGFGARILKSNEKAPKYINSPENEVYNKSRIVYGIYFAKQQIHRNDKCYLVEGYTDVISLYQAGVQNVVSSSGTSLTTGQIDLIKKYTQNITILFDGDAAGLKASFRGIDMILDNGMNVKVVLFPEGEDPDSYAQKHTQDELEEFLKANEIDFIRFKAGILMKDAANDPIQKAAAIKDIVNSIALVKDGILRTLYIQQCSELMDVPEGTLISELNKTRRELTKSRMKKDGWQEYEIEYSSDESAILPEQELQELPDVQPHEKELLRLLMNYADLVMQFEQVSEEGDLETINTTVGYYLVQDIVNDEILFDDPLYQQFFNEMAELVNLEKYDEISSYFLHHSDDDINKLSIDLVAKKHEISENWLDKHGIVVPTEEDQIAKTVFEILHNFKAAKLEQIIDGLRKKLEVPGDDSMELLSDINEKQMVRRSLSDRLSIVIWK